MNIFGFLFYKPQYDLITNNIYMTYISHELSTVDKFINTLLLLLLLTLFDIFIFDLIIILLIIYTKPLISNLQQHLNIK